MCNGLSRMPRHVTPAASYKSSARRSRTIMLFRMLSELLPPALLDQRIADSYTFIRVYHDHAGGTGRHERTNTMAVAIVAGVIRYDGQILANFNGGVKVTKP